jgi:predicted signal transduction protein with EAL and GGDEF domain
MIDDSDLATQQLTELRSNGIRTALDDFGTGYSSLAYVQRLPLDIIKIDKEFVQSVNEVRSQALANTIVNMARNLGLRTVAEGVESESQALELNRLGCEFAQGYLFFKPLSAVAMTALSEFEHKPVDVSGSGPNDRPELVSAFASPPSQLPGQQAMALPPPSGQLAAVEAHPPPLPAGQRQAGEQRPRDEPSGEIEHLLRPLLSN